MSLGHIPNEFATSFAIHCPVAPWPAGKSGAVGEIVGEIRNRSEARETLSIRFLANPEVGDTGLHPRLFVVLLKLRGSFRLCAGLPRKFLKMLPSRTIFLLTLLFIGQAHSSDTSERGEDCTAFDRCKSGDLFRTCSCDSDCYKYATCCSDSDQYDLMASEKAQYLCHTDRSSTPVYAKKSCSDSYSGHESHTQICHEGISDKADILGNLLVTSTKTKITYWNQDCAICNNEKIKDLKHWAVQVACPSKHGDSTFRKSYIEDHLTYDLDLEEWGLRVKDGFVVCTITFNQPSRMVGKLNYCAPNLVSKCPEGYSEEGVLAKCLSYHAERKQKETKLYFRNPHCALCNGVSENDLECVGRNYSPLNYAKGKDLVKVVFDSGEWLDRNATEKYKCSNGNTHDPFQNRCREFPESILRELNYTMYKSDAERLITSAFILVSTVLIVLL